VRIQFKFREDAEESERRRILDGVEGAERLFPDEEDPELTTLYVADLPDDRAAEALVDLQRSKAVEFAEPEAERRLHLPEELKGR
jgi:hypothetical protein